MSEDEKLLSLLKKHIYLKINTLYFEQNLSWTLEHVLWHVIASDLLLLNYHLGIFSGALVNKHEYCVLNIIIVTTIVAIFYRFTIA